MIETSYIKKALDGRESWKNFCDSVSKEKDIFLSRKDGAVISSDLGLKFNTEDNIIVSNSSVKTLFQSSISREISYSDLIFCINLLLLSGFEFEDDELESSLYDLSSLEVTDPENGFQEIKQSLEIISQ